jgi:beta-lactamase class D
MPTRTSPGALLRRLLLLSALLAVLAPAAAPARTVDRPDLLRHFAAAGTTGTMVVHEEGEGRPHTVIVGRERSAARFLPSSTFKIPNSLIAIDRGVASGAEQPYPGPNPNYLVDGAPLLPVACEGDLTLATAFANSCIPIYQRIARAVGAPAYRRDLTRLHYGNRRIDGAPLDAFWLTGPFGISAREQVAFLERLRRRAVPFSRHAVDAVRAMMVVQRDEDVVLRAKTGYVFTTAPRVGWWIGWVERGRRTWSFALNLDVSQPAHLAARAAIGRAVLTELGALG